MKKQWVVVIDYRNGPYVAIVTDSLCKAWGKAMSDLDELIAVDKKDRTYRVTSTRDLPCYGGFEFNVYDDEGMEYLVRMFEYTPEYDEDED